ncbi:CpaF family protein [Paenarthrobacter nicotinovorans]|uniref:CpaF family protein n=1 Tax=Paenarthrobacter nicotinovorans TaxID=29320 RepID=UPI00119EE34E|nr:CpaF/VirB11 family protein [Paenarthrobacter nicotinovorans]
MTGPSADPSALNLGSLPLFAEPSAAEIPTGSRRNPHLAANTSAMPPRTPAPAPRRAAAIPRAAASAAVPARTSPPRARFLQYQEEQRRRREMRWELLDWKDVKAIQSVVAERIANFTDKNQDVNAEAQEQHGRAIVAEEVLQQAKAGFETGGVDWSIEYQELLREGVFIEQFRVGQLQLLLDVDGVEDIIIINDGRVFLRRSGGHIEERPPIASSDEELISMLQRIGSGNNVGGSRTIADTDPMMNMTLPGGERLAAVMPPIDKSVSINIRKHNLIDVTLEDLQRSRTLTEAHMELLTAAVKAGLNIVVAGKPAAGKTTFLRALCNVLDPDEPIVTIEDVRELHLDLMADRHRIIMPWQSVEGSGSRNPDGRRTGDIYLSDLLYQSLRHSVSRILVGEVRSREIVPMFEASRAGTGSLSTVHASSCAEAIDRLATLYQQAVLGTPPDIAYTEVGENVDLIVHLANKRVEGNMHRYVTEIAEVHMGEMQGRRWPVSRTIFKAARGSFHAAPADALREDTRELLAEHGFDAQRWLQPEGMVL